MKMHAESHIDHGFTDAQWKYIFEKYAAKTAFFIDTFELPEDLGTVTHALYGPTAGDAALDEHEVFYAKRGDRKRESRMTNKPKRPTRFVRVIAGPHNASCLACDGEGFTEQESLHHEWVKTPCSQCLDGSIRHECILYTAYGVASIDMPMAPKETWDLVDEITVLEDTYDDSPECRDEIARLYAKLSDARYFWCNHALAALEAV